jgi:CBS-domain-containing membrane protein
MLRARDIMKREVITVSPQTKTVEAANVMLENRINGLPVVDDQGCVKGILCQSDLIAQQEEIRLPSFFTLLDGFIPLTSYKHFEKEVQKIAAVTVEQAMTPNPITVEPETTLTELATLMVNKNIHTLPVVDKGKLVGIIGKEDVLRTLIPTE